MILSYFYTALTKIKKMKTCKIPLERAEDTEGQRDLFSSSKHQELKKAVVAISYFLLLWQNTWQEAIKEEGLILACSTRRYIRLLWEVGMRVGEGRWAGAWGGVTWHPQSAETWTLLLCSLGQFYSVWDPSPWGDHPNSGCVFLCQLT